MRLDRRTALVTGGSRGIGFSVARLLASRGCRVMICGRDPALLENARAALENVEAFACDVGDADDAGRLIAHVRKRFGGLNLLVNNAGVQYASNFLAEDAAATARAIESEIAINLVGPLRLSALAMPLLHAQDEAAIVNVASALAISPKPSAPVYCATKSGLRTFSTALRHQLQGAGSAVRVVDIVLPIVDTAMTAGRGKWKISADRAAASIVRAVERDKDVAFVGGARLLAWFLRLFPGLGDR